jgi:hypothetical protein
VLPDKKTRGDDHGDEACTVRRDQRLSDLRGRPQGMCQ